MLIRVLYIYIYIHIFIYSYLYLYVYLFLFACLKQCPFFWLRFFSALKAGKGRVLARDEPRDSVAAAEWAISERAWAPRHRRMYVCMCIYIYI